MKDLVNLVSVSMDQNIPVYAISSNSKEVSPGSLFIAVSGHASDGVDYLQDAVEKGAVAVVVEEGKREKALEKIDKNKVLIIWVEDSRKALVDIASKFYDKQPKHIAAITGTSGKSSIVWFVRQIMSDLGFSTASLGTIGLHAEGFFEKGALTTADPISLHKTLEMLSEKKIDYLAMEASSHGIEQHRLDGVQLKVAAFTNLSQDHLDYHKDMDAYFEAKQRLFTQCLDQKGIAILNADIPEFKKLSEICEVRNLKTISYGIHALGDNTVTLVNRSVKENGQDLVLLISNQRVELDLPLIGAFQAQNVLCAIAIVYALVDEKIELNALVKIVSNLKTVPGRLERIEGHPEGASVYVDYAHKPGALNAVLNAVRPHTKGILYVVFGCGGDRDRGKRSQMAQIAQDLADEVIVTDDNPRTEDPAAIRAEIVAGFPSFKNIGDRRKAIDFAISSLRTGDSLIIAGKGHESGQTFQAQTLPFDDRDETRKSIQSLINKDKEK